MRQLVVSLFLLAAFLCSCTKAPQPYVIGVSQCSEDIWRDKQNAELLMSSYLHDNVELRFASAYDSDERQVQQIDSLLTAGIDLLIVAPNQVATISPAIDRAYDRGIPVIVFERKTNSRKFTAFMSADNYEMGHQMGEYIAKRLGGKGRVMEVMGLKGSSPAIDRHKGFADAIGRYPDITIAATLQGDWTEQSAFKAVESYGGELSSIDYVFAQNDRMAMGARKAFMQHNAQSAKTRFCGIDGLPGEDGGIRLVRDSILDASYIYPTHGDQLIQLAVDILEGKPYEKETHLQSALVTRDNADVLFMQSGEIMRQAAYLDQLHNKADSYVQQLDTQRTITWLACAIIALLIVAIVLLYLYYIGKANMQRERIANTLWDLAPEPEPARSEEQVTEKGEEPTSGSNEKQATERSNEAEEKSEEHATEKSEDRAERSEEPNTTSLFITRFRSVVEARLSDSELSVEDLAADMHLSRVQLYRKVKAVSGSTPNELLRSARLKRAYQLLLTTDKSISEVAYLVGFTAPSYFTKCFKEEYGQLPGEIKKGVD